MIVDNGRLFCMLLAVVGLSHLVAPSAVGQSATNGPAAEAATNAVAEEAEAAADSGAATDEKEGGSGGQIPGVEHISPSMAVLLVLLLGPVFVFVALAKKGRKLFLRRLPGVDAVDEAIGRAVEMGRPMLFSTGLTLVNPNLFAGLGVLGHVAGRAATYGSRLFVPAFDPEVMAIVQDVIHQAYRSAGREDVFDPDCVRFLSTHQFAYASGYMGICHREKAAACFLFGEFAAESLILAEAGQQVGAIQVAGTPTNEQIPFFVTTCDFTIIGEEYYAVSAYLSREPVLLGSLRGQDIAKLVVFALVLVGVAWATATQLTGYEVELASWIVPGPR